MKVIGIIPIKLNNQRLPGKNLRKLGNRLLCQYLFSTISKVNNIDEVYVYCSDESICSYIPEGIHFLKRPKALDTNETKSTDILNAFINNVNADIYALCHVTQPFIKCQTIENAINQVINGNHDSAFTAHQITEFTWFRGKPLNYSLDNVVQTQKLESIYTEGELFVFKKEVFTKMGRRIGDTPYIQPISWKENVCIDDINDFHLAEAVVALGDIYDEKSCDD